MGFVVMQKQLAKEAVLSVRESENIPRALAVFSNTSSLPRPGPTTRP